MSATPDVAEAPAAEVATTARFVPAPAPPRNAWGVAPAAAPASAPTSLSEVMSEQLAGQLAKKEEEEDEKVLCRQFEGFSEAAAASASAQAEDDECKDDLLIAQMLQMQFDKEYDEVLKKEEAHHNGSSKVKVIRSTSHAHAHYMTVPDGACCVHR